ncbi:MAG: amino acid permease, partial [Chloroflexi bacterium]|nr:amino acid permease [Chloroflexota bacterium]
RIGIVPDPRELETVNSQLTRLLVGTGTYYYLVQVATAVLLVLAANTAFNGFPRLASILARDRYMPRTFQFRGERLAYTAGIVLLSLVASALIVIYQGSVTGLIPLYTVGVFIAFTLSQAGLVRRWIRLRTQGPGWRLGVAVNGLGTLVTGTVAIVVGVSKFTLGAWMVLVLIPILVLMMWSISRHYVALARATRPETPLSPEMIHTRVIVPIASLNVPARQALAFAQAIARGDRDVVAVHVTDDAAEAAALQQQWEQAGYTNPLVIIESPYRSLAGPLLAYVDALKADHPSDTIAVILPEYVPSHWWEHFLHNQTALRLKAALLFVPGVIVASVPYHVGRLDETRGHGDAETR